jgi:5-methylcytosine-specific restriction endonuclease McrA
MPRNDLRGLSGWGESGQRTTRCAAALHVTILPTPPWRAETSVRAASERDRAMKQLQAKQWPVRLPTREYEVLRQRVLRRDSWRRQLCGSMMNLEVHHQLFRSHSGSDNEDNLITLCTDCHSSVHCVGKTADEDT